MAASLYDISVASYLQVLNGASGFLEKGRTHCTENGIDLIDIMETRLFDDMLPFRFQVVSVAHHSLGSVNAIKSGTFSPWGGPPDLDYEGAQKLIDDAIAELNGISRQEIDALKGGDVIFRIGEREIPFTAEHFVLSFSTPNLYFHSTTAYDILRMKGAPIGKRDFMGPLRIK